MDDAEGDGADTKEEHEEVPAACNGRTGRRESCEEDQAPRDQGELLKDIADGVVVGEIHKGLRHPDERENGVESGEGQSANAGGAGHEKHDPTGEFDDRGEIGERYAQRDVGADVLPDRGEVAGDKAEDAEKDGGSAVDVKPEI